MAYDPGEQRARPRQGGLTGTDGGSNVGHSRETPGVPSGLDLNLAGLCNERTHPEPSLVALQLLPPSGRRGGADPQPGGVAHAEPLAERIERFRTEKEAMKTTDATAGANGTSTGTMPGINGDLGHVENTLGRARSQAVARRRQVGHG